MTSAVDDWRPSPVQRERDALRRRQTRRSIGVSALSTVLVLGLAGLGTQLQQAGAGFRDTMTEVGRTLGGIPLIGGGIRAPFDGASQAGQALETAGRDQQEAVLQLALGLGIGLPAIPILMILVLWLVPRVGFVRRAGRARAAAATPAGDDLLALRALATARLPAIAAVSPDALEAWRRGDRDVVARLAALELRAAGVRPRP